MGDARRGPLYAVGYTDVVAARYSTCGLKPDGTLDCWGISSRILKPPSNSDGGQYTFSAMDGGQTAFCGILDNQNGQTAGQMVCWYSSTSQVNSDQPPSSTMVSIVRIGPTNACALHASGADAGKPVCWGFSEQGGIRLTAPEPGEDAEPAVPDLAMTDIAVGDSFACGILSDGADAGKIHCWGKDHHDEVSAAPAEAGFSAIEASDHHACAMKTDATIVCWGAATYPGYTLNTLGDVNHGQAEVPAGLSAATFSTMDLSRRLTCGILDGQNGQTAGELKCWGEERYDELDPYFTDYIRPEFFDSGLKTPPEDRPALPLLDTGLDAIAADDFTTCARTAAGDGEVGQMICLGLGYQPLPVNNAARVIVGNSNVCALRPNGKLRCWGGISYGLSSGAPNPGHINGGNAIAADLDTLTFSTVSSGWLHMCGILDGESGQTAGQLRCWGDNRARYGRLSTIPSDIASATFSHVSASLWHTCAIQDGQNGQTPGPGEMLGHPAEGTRC